jgi:pilus assembly protein Flp/PilA
MKKVMNKVVGLIKNEEGQGMVEYALIVAGIAVVIVVVIALFGDKITLLINGITL